MTCNEAWKSLIEGIKDKYMDCHRMCDLRVSDIVKVVHKYDTWECGCMLSWNPDMDDTVGKIGQITSVLDRGFMVGFDDGREYIYPFFVLEKAEEPKPKLKPGQLVLVKRMHCTDNGTKFIWCIDIFSHIINIMDKKRYVTTSSTYDESNCIQYEGNEHLLGKEAK